MMFQVERASLWGLGKPCDGGVIGPPPAVEWLRQEWFVEIETLEELLAFVKANEGRVIVDLDDYSFHMRPPAAPRWKITIYDAYLE